MPIKRTPKAILTLLFLVSLPPLYYLNREAIYKQQRRLAGTDRFHHITKADEPVQPQSNPAAPPPATAL